MEKLDAMINTFNTDQALRQSDVDALASQMAANQDLYSSSDLQFRLNTEHGGVIRQIDIATDHLGPSRISVDETAMAAFYRAGVSGAAFTMSIVDGDFDREAFVHTIQQRSICLL